MRESNYWLRLVKATLPELREDTELNWLLTESGELKRILGSIVSETNR